MTLPWASVSEAIDGALRARLLERTLGSESWPCDYAGAQAVKLLKFRLRMEFGGGAPLPDVVVDEIKTILKNISSELEWR